MHRLVVTLGAAAAAALALTAAAPASAAPLHHSGDQRLVIHERIDFNAGVIRFTAEGPVCRSGVQEDTVTDAQTLDERRDIQRFTIDSRYVCDDGSGAFAATKVIVVDYAPDGSSISRGPIRFDGGTWRYRHLAASGTDSGRVNADGYGVGIVQARVERR